MPFSTAFAEDLAVTEFLARNQTGLRDADGDTVDWLEVGNRTSQAVDLDGWHLTDDPVLLNKWRFPPLVLEPGQHVVVFASGKNRAVTGEEMHANFRLNGSGEYLALVRPDGTVAHAYAPAYPPQHEDVSYGLAVEVTSFLTSGAPVDIRVPTALDDGLAWTAAEFAPPASWFAGATGVGFDTAEEAGEALTSAWPFDGDLLDLVHANHGTFRGAAAPTYVADRAGNTASAVRFDGVDDYVEVTQAFDLPIYNHDAFSVAMWVKGGAQADKRVYSEGSSSNNTPVFNIGTDVSGNTGRVDIFIRNASGSALMPHRQSAGIAFDNQWHHLAWVDTGGDAVLYIDGQSDPVDFSYPKEPLPLNRTSIGAILRAGSSFHFNGVIDAPAVWTRALTPEEVAVLAAGQAPTGLSSYAPLIATDVEAQMKDANASIFLRLPFNVADAARFDTLTLQMRYDDGFVAFLNGIEVAARHAPAVLAWNAAATQSQSRDAAQRAEEISLSAHTGSLRSGQNVLAIQGLNRDASDPDFLIVPELFGAASDRATVRYFKEPTPGATNRGGVIDFVAPIEFSHARGYYEAAFTLTLATPTAEATIRYTTDGSAPTASHGALYSAPIDVAATTVLRAAAFKDEYEPAPAASHTYIFPADVVRQTRPPGFPSTWGGATADYDMDPEIVDHPSYADRVLDGLIALPAISVVMDQEDLFGSSGIYANPQRTGRAWERPASAEVIYPDERVGPQINCGARITGNRSRSPANSPKHGIRLVFRGEYGPTKFRYPVFPDSQVERFDTLIIRPNAFDSWVSDNSDQRRGATYMRDEWVRKAQRDTGEPVVHSFYVHLYLNGAYWGLYILTERPDASYGEEYFGGEKEEYDAVKNHEEVVDGNREAYDTIDALRAAGFASAAAYEEAKNFLDIESLIDYMIVNMYGPSTDWPGNYYMLRRRQEGAGFLFFSWDSEYAFLGGVNNNRTLPHWRDDDSPTKFYHALRANAEFRVQFGDHVHRHFFGNGILTPEAVTRLWETSAGEIRDALACESARWGDYRRSTPYTPNNEWAAEQDYLINEYFPQRTAIVLNQFRAQGVYPQVVAPTFSHAGQPTLGGLITTGYELDIDAPSGTVYYTNDGSDPRLEGGAISPDATALPANLSLPITETSWVHTRALDGAAWSALQTGLFYYDFPLRITELMYHPPEPDPASAYAADDFEFVELQNVGQETLDLRGCELRGGIRYRFPEDFPSLGPGDVVVVVKNFFAFLERYPMAGLNLAGAYEGRLSNAGEEIELVGPVGEPILKFAFDVTWEPATDGMGYSLEFADPAAPREAWGDGSLWVASREPGGSPGLVEPRDLQDYGWQAIGDGNQDGRVDVSDAVRLLLLLFASVEIEWPCDTAPAGEAVVDANGDAFFNVADPVYLLNYLFAGGPAPIGGASCRRLPNCPDVCLP